MHRAQDRYPSTFGAAYAAFAEKSLRQQTSRRREMVPCVKEICSVLAMKEVETVIHCYGGATCNISINSATTVGKVSTSEMLVCTDHEVRRARNYFFCVFILFCFPANIAIEFQVKFT